MTARRVEILRRSKELRRRVGIAEVHAYSQVSQDDRDGQGKPGSGRTVDPSMKCAVEQDYSPAALGTFSRLYESPDGMFCLFEDGQGHLSAVNAARFA